MRSLRVALGASSMVLFAMVAHILAGGALTPGRELFLMALSVIALVAVLLPAIAEGPALAALAVLVQLLGHMVLGTTTPNELRMTGAHLLAGCLSYMLVLRFDALLNWLLLGLAPAAVQAAISGPTPFTKAAPSSIASNFCNLGNSLLRFTVVGRAPPISVFS